MITKKEFSEQIGVRLTKEDRRELERVAREQRRAPGQLCRIVIEDFLQKQRKEQAAA